MTDLGRWSRRDPLGYVDGMGLYEYVASRPHTHLDPIGNALIPVNSPPFDPDRRTAPPKGPRGLLRLCRQVGPSECDPWAEEQVGTISYSAGSPPCFFQRNCDGACTIKVKSTLVEFRLCEALYRCTFPGFPSFEAILTYREERGRREVEDFEAGILVAHPMTGCACSSNISGAILPLPDCGGP